MQYFFPVSVWLLYMSVMQNDSCQWSRLCRQSHCLFGVEGQTCMIQYFSYVGTRAWGSAVVLCCFGLITHMPAHNDEYSVNIQLPLVLCCGNTFVGRGMDLCPTLETRRNAYSMAKTDRKVFGGLQWCLSPPQAYSFLAPQKWRLVLNLYTGEGSGG